MSNALDTAINYSRAEQQRKKLNDAAKNFESVSSEIQKQLSVLEEAWVGKSGTAVQEKLTELKSKNDKLVSELKEVSDTINMVITEMKNTDYVINEKISIKLK